MLEAMWLRSTLEVNGISGGYAGPGLKMVLPHVASAKISCRLGVGHDPHAVAANIERHLRAHCPATATLSIDREPWRRPWPTSCRRTTPPCWRSSA